MKSIQLASLNEKGLKDRSQLLRNLLSFSTDMPAILEIHFVCEVDARCGLANLLSIQHMGSQLARGDSLLLKRSLAVGLVVVDMAVRPMSTGSVPTLSVSWGRF